jgi:putative ABC transport system permease protein
MNTSDCGTDAFAEIIGVVADSRDGASAATVKPKVYSSYKQDSFLGPTQMTLLVRASSGNAAALAQPLRRLVAEMNSDQPVYNVLPLEDILRSRFARERAMATVMNAFAMLTLVVAVLGVHAAMAYAGARRRHEIGVRLALGGSRVAILRSLAWGGGKPMLAGVEAGILLAVTGVSFLRAWLFGTGSSDMPTMIGAVVLVTAVSAVALLAPAWCATQVDPIETLRAE